LRRRGAVTRCRNWVTRVEIDQSRARNAETRPKLSPKNEYAAVSSRRGPRIGSRVDARKRPQCPHTESIQSVRPSSVRRNGLSPTGIGAPFIRFARGSPERGSAKARFHAGLHISRTSVRRFAGQAEPRRRGTAP
jgi:hypothetical protein